jgi:cyclic pyranopterin phosphate synthase
MDNVNYWKILRILTTDTCNFNCVFCHNEGQNISRKQYLSFNNFKTILLALADKPIKEIQFSGGEPFLNKETIKMIEWVNDNTSYEIGCATNLSLLKYEDINILSNTRISLNIQFPAIKLKEYQAITNTKSGRKLHNKLLLLNSKGIEFKLNFVWLSEDISKLEDIINYCYKYSFNLKILPYISAKTLISNLFKEKAVDYISKRFGKELNRGDGSIVWKIKDSTSELTIKYVDSPCFKKDHAICKNYAELRVLPNLYLQNCLLKNSTIFLTNEDLKISKNIIDKIDLTWETFTSC